MKRAPCSGHDAGHRVSSRKGTDILSSMKVGLEPACYRSSGGDVSLCPRLCTTGAPDRHRKGDLTAALHRDTSFPGVSVCKTTVSVNRW